MERIHTTDIWQGRIISVREDRFRYEDGGEADREIVSHPGAVAVLPFDGEALWMVRQPREAVGEPALLEIPAGKLDVDGEPPERTARRELAEEIGRGARRWTHLTSFYNSPGILDETTHVYLAEELYEERADSGEEERIEIERVPVGRLDETIASVKDAHTLVALLWFRAFRR